MLLERKCRRFLIVESVRVQPPSLLSGAGFAQLCLGLQGHGPCCLFLLLPCAKQQSCLLLPCLGFLKPLCCVSLIKYLLWKHFWHPPVTCSAKACCYFVCSVAKGSWQVSPVRSSWGWFLWIPNMSRLEEQAFFKMIDFPRLHRVNVLSTRDPRGSLQHWQLSRCAPQTLDAGLIPKRDRLYLQNYISFNCCSTAIFSDSSSKVLLYNSGQSDDPQHAGLFVSCLQDILSCAMVLLVHQKKSLCHSETWTVPFVLTKKTQQNTKQTKHQWSNNHIRLSLEISYAFFLKPIIITENSSLQDSVYWPHLWINTPALNSSPECPGYVLHSCAVRHTLYFSREQY